MKRYFFTTLCVLTLTCFTAASQLDVTESKADTLRTIDTLVDVGGYRLHFRIVRGTGTPILFESGSGADVSNWDPILHPIAQATHATLITYERPGFGKSGVDTSNDDVKKHGILQAIEGLERGLATLGYSQKIMIVASSLGGFYATFFASRHAESVQAAVFIDANLVCWFTDEFVDREMEERRKIGDSIKKVDLGYYYQALNLRNNVDLIRATPFPSSIPVVDLVAERNFPDSLMAARWKLCHEEFVAGHHNRHGEIVHGSDHVIYRDKPKVVIRAISRAYHSTSRTE